MHVQWHTASLERMESVENHVAEAADKYTQLKEASAAHGEQNITLQERICDGENDFGGVAHEYARLDKTHALLLERTECVDKLLATPARKNAVWE